MHNLKIKGSKCHFAKTTAEYLGFKLTPEGILPGMDKTQCIREAKIPTAITHVRQFLGLCDFFRRHIKNFNELAEPLNKLLTKESKWEKGESPKDALHAFGKLKTALTSHPVLAYPRPDRQYALITDVSLGSDKNRGGCGAILTQIDEAGNFRVVAYASKTITGSPLNYTPFLAEMYAANWGMKQFEHYLKGKKFLLFTDHKPMEKLGKVHTKTLYSIQEAMLQFDFEIHYLKGKECQQTFCPDSVQWTRSRELQLKR